MPKIVYSRTLERADWNATVVREVVADDVHRLKAGPGGDLALGGADLAATFRRLDLIDEYRLYVHPVILGAGRPLFPASERPTELRLVDTQRFGNGVVALHYAR
jgi:dihydrofolate reductase